MERVDSFKCREQVADEIKSRLDGARAASIRQLQAMATVYAIVVLTLTSYAEFSGWCQLYDLPSIPLQHAPSCVGYAARHEAIELIRYLLVDRLKDCRFVGE